MKEIIDEVKSYIKFWWFKNERNIHRHLRKLGEFLVLWLRTSAYVLLIFGALYYAVKSADVPSNYNTIKLALCIITIIALFIYHMGGMDDDW